MGDGGGDWEVERNWALVFFSKPAAGRAALMQTKTLPTVHLWLALTPPRSPPIGDMSESCRLGNNPRKRKRFALVKFQSDSLQVERNLFQIQTQDVWACGDIRTIWLNYLLVLFFFWQHFNAHSFMNIFCSVGREHGWTALPWQQSAAGIEPPFRGCRQTLNISQGLMNIMTYWWMCCVPSLLGWRDLALRCWIRTPKQPWHADIAQLPRTAILYLNV